MDSVFRPDLLEQETHFFFKRTFLIPQYLSQHKYVIPYEEKKDIIENVKNAEIKIPRAQTLASDSYITENFMRRCFNKCKEFVLEDWIDYDELDCSMKCTLLHKKSLEIMKESYKNL